MHSSQHACYESINAPALLDKRDKGRDTTLIVCRVPEVRENQALKRIDLILKSHQVRNRFIPKKCVNEVLWLEMQQYSPFIRIINTFEGDILLIFEKTIKFRPNAMEPQFRQEECDVGPYQRAVSYE